MRRPLCVFCAGTLGLELVCAFLPQTGRFVPFAAFFVASLLWALAGRLRKSPAWGYGICLILGAVLGLVLTGSTQAKWDAIQTAYDGRSVLLEAEVESTSSSYFPGRVRAVLRVETVDRGAASLRVECASLPACSPGDRVKGRFALEMPDDTSRLNALADGIALNAAYEKGFALLGQSTSFRARTARLQKRRNPDCKIAFIGPCAAKKLEASRRTVRSDVDFVLTFEEMAGIFAAKHVDLTTIEEDPDGVNDASTDGRSFAVGGGVAKAVEKVIEKLEPDRQVKTVYAEGLRECRKMLRIARTGKYDGYLLEGMACPGGCIAGAGTLADPARSAMMLNKYKAQATMKTAADTPYKDTLDKLKY